MARKQATARTPRGALGEVGLNKSTGRPVAYVIWSPRRAKSATKRFGLRKRATERTSLCHCMQVRSTKALRNELLPSIPLTRCPMTRSSLGTSLHMRHRLERPRRSFGLHCNCRPGDTQEHGGKPYSHEEHLLADGLIGVLQCACMRSYLALPVLSFRTRSIRVEIVHCGSLLMRSLVKWYQKLEAPGLACDGGSQVPVVVGDPDIRPPSLASIIQLTESEIPQRLQTRPKTSYAL